ncbi:MAG: SLC13 family permease, partial [Myxococcota bacterium]|nr:SLC13 family permease [Myxococcota bacterium]
MKATIPIGLILAVLGGTLSAVGGLTLPQSGLVGTTILCGFWWVTEAIPIPATSMLPFALFPFFQVLDHKQVASSYGHHMILLLLGGFLLSKGLESSGVHKRFAMWMIRMCGTGGKRLVLGFMLASAVCSMWISNTATVLMLLPVALAVVEKDSPLCIPLFLGMAYAASIGGMGTPIGTPPNMILLSQLGREIAFLDWMLLTLPLVVTFLFLAWLWLTRGIGESKAVKIPILGAWTWAECASISVFVLAAFLWVFRKNPFGGWSTWIGVERWVGDSSIAMFCATLLFV